MSDIENVTFTMQGLKEYIEWQTTDRRTLTKINKLINDIVRNGNDGIGHPEQLKGNLQGWWSREINEKDRIVYRIQNNNTVEIMQCKGHYDNK
ncbi:MAG: Txe/YoeB family addiction module toxin [Candidatus Cloacimonetes bacterium]|nr:Txe/YoeB family addiction module toxin [Candidatus Cloacimonadota bacterium]